MPGSCVKGNGRAVCPAYPERVKAAATPALTYGRATPRLPIWVHMMLFAVSFVLGWIGMPALILIGLQRVVPAAVAGIAFLPLWIGGLVLVHHLVKRAILARCTSCLGRAYCAQMSKPMRYVCRDCGYEHRSA